MERIIRCGFVTQAAWRRRIAFQKRVIVMEHQHLHTLTRVGGEEDGRQRRELLHRRKRVHQRLGVQAHLQMAQLAASGIHVPSSCSVGMRCAPL